MLDLLDRSATEPAHFSDMRCQDYMLSQILIPLWMCSQKVQAVRIQDQRLFLPGSRREKPLFSLTAGH